ncbi:MAG: SAM-dependent methyltransferase [Synechococcaceae cyanobacterium SM2_3_1]|nr:SAM-dependent methyltransferase [Synechococcaceae cyanobacterium SM2_3_1]
MTRKTLNLSDSLYMYLLETSLREPLILQQLRQETAEMHNARMQISPDQGQFMSLLIQLMAARRALEIGVFTGYSALWVALALPPEGRLIACDVSKEYTSIAQRYWQQAGVAPKIQLHLQPAIQTLDQLLQEGQAGTFDFAFIDADKQNYDLYYERGLQLLRPGGLICIDNVLWSGRVADPEVQDASTEAIRALNHKIHQDGRVILSLVPIGDGLLLARKQEM